MSFNFFSSLFFSSILTLNTLSSTLNPALPYLNAKRMFGPTLSQNGLLLGPAGQPAYLCYKPKQSVFTVSTWTAPKFQCKALKIEAIDRPSLTTVYKEQAYEEALQNEDFMRQNPMLVFPTEMEMFYQELCIDLYAFFDFIEELRAVNPQKKKPKTQSHHYHQPVSKKFWQIFY